MLMFHMTTLAQPDKVRSLVCLFCGFKKPKWPYVMNGEAFPDVFAAFATTPLLISNNFRPRSGPTPPAIRSWPANPIWGVLAAWSRRIPARFRAESGDAVLPSQPRLLFKSVPAIFAYKLKAVLPFRAGPSANVLRLEGIRRSLSDAELVAYQVRFRRGIQELLRLPLRAAGCAAKSSRFVPIWFNKILRLADFTGFFNHSPNIPSPAMMGKRTTLITRTNGL